MISPNRIEIVEIEDQRIRLFDGRPESAICHECECDLTSETEEMAGLCDDCQRLRRMAEESRGEL